MRSGADIGNQIQRQCLNHAILGESDLVVTGRFPRMAANHQALNVLFNHRTGRLSRRAANARALPRDNGCSAEPTANVGLDDMDRSLRYCQGFRQKSSNLMGLLGRVPERKQ